LEQAFIAEDDRRNADPTTEFREQIDAATAGVKAYTAINSDEQAVKAASLRNMLLKLAGDADKTRVAEKEPHLKAGRDVDAKWQPLVREAQAAAQSIRSAMEEWETTKRRAAQEAARRQQEAVARAAAENRPIPAPPPSNLPEPTTQVRPTYGKAASVGTQMKVVSIDADKLLAALKPRPEWNYVEQFLFELAQKLANKGIILDGVKAEEKASIR
jgi:hypothetical protein